MFNLHLPHPAFIHHTAPDNHFKTHPIIYNTVDLKLFHLHKNTRTDTYK